MHTNIKIRTTEDVVDRFMELAKDEKWFEIQEELFDNDVKSIDPSHSPYFPFAQGKANIRRKGEEFVKDIVKAHNLVTGAPIVAKDHFALRRVVDVTHNVFGRVHLDQIMLYEVKDGKIVTEQFFY
jgi:hypothetical protein